MATQEPNVYAGLAVVIGGLMHARPKFFAKVMGELLFWVGEDKMLFGSDYAIWEPKWQIEGFVDWEMPDDAELADYPRLGVEGKKKILGLNAAKLYGVEVPEELRGCPAPRRASPAVARTAQLGRVAREPACPSPRGARDGLRPGARRADHHARLRRLLRRDRRGRRVGAPAAPTPQCAPNFAFLMAADARAAVRARRRGARASTIELEDHYTGDGDQRRGRARRGLLGRVPGRDRRASWTRCARCSSARRCSPARGAAAGRGRRPAAATLGELTGAGRRALRELRRALGIDASDDAPPFVTGDGAPVRRLRALSRGWRR